MRAEPWPDETMRARFHSGVIISPQLALCCGGRHRRPCARCGLAGLPIEAVRGREMAQTRIGVMRALAEVTPNASSLEAARP